MSSLARDLVYGLRVMRKSPGFTVVAVVALALGIGANTAIFSVINALLLRPLPYPEPDRLVMIWEHSPRSGNRRNVTSPANFLDWKAQNSVFSAMGSYASFTPILTLTGIGEPQELRSQRVTGDFLPAIGVQPAMGRTLQPDDGRPGVESVVVLSDKTWRERFGADQNILGRRITLSDGNYTVVGVMPSGFYFTSRNVEVWLPLTIDPARDYRRTSGRYLHTVARLKPGVTVEQAQAQLSAIAKRLSERYPEFNTNWGVNVVPVEEHYVGDVRRALMVLMAAVGVVLLIACSNIANLLLARAAGRRREIAVRTSLGAPRLRLVRQLVTESVLLAVVGGALGVVLAFWGLDALLALHKDLPRADEVRINGTVLLFTMAASIITGLIFGVLPAFAATRTDLYEALKDGSRSTGASGAKGLRGGLAIVEVGLSLVLLTGAGLLIRSFLKLSSVDPGFRSEDLITFRLAGPGDQDEKDRRSTRFFDDAIERIASVPGIVSASAVNFLPFSGLRSATSFRIGGRPVPPRGQEPVTDVRVIEPRYFGTLGISLLQGRDFDARDNAAGAQPGFIVNQAFVKRFFTNDDPLSQTISVAMGRGNPFGRIVGVVSDMRDLALDTEPLPTVYYPYGQLPTGAMTMVIRANAPPETLLAAIKERISALSPNHAAPELRTLERTISGTLERPKLYLVLLLVFAGVAVVLAAVGVYGVIAYSVAQRTREIGLRMALGAQKRDVLGMIVGHGMLLAGAGLAAGALAAFAVTRWMKTLLYEVQPSDPLAFAGAMLFLALVALVACWVPAHRAARIDPMVALRYE